MRHLLLLLVLFPSLSIAQFERVWEKPGVEFAIFSPDGKLFVTPGENNYGQIVVRNVATGNPVVKFRMPREIGGAVWYPPSNDEPDIQFSPNNSHVLTISHWGRMQSNRVYEHVILSLWDISTGTESSRHAISYRGNIYSAAFSPDGALLAYRLCNEIRLLDVNKGVEVRKIHRGEKFCPRETESFNDSFLLAFLPDGSLMGIERDDIEIYNLDYDYYVGRVWQPSTGKEINKISISNTADWGIISNRSRLIPKKLIVSPDGSYLATELSGSYRDCRGCRRDFLKVIDLRTDTRVLYTGLSHEATFELSFSPDGSYIGILNGDLTSVKYPKPNRDRHNPGRFPKRMSIYGLEGSMYQEGHIDFVHHYELRSVIGDISKDMRFMLTFPIDSHDAQYYTGNMELIKLIPNFREDIKNQRYTLSIPIIPLQLPDAYGISPITYTLTPGLPSGLRYNAQTKTILGTPTAPTSAPIKYTYTATSINGESRSLHFNINVSAPSFAESTSSLPSKFAVAGNYPNPFQGATTLGVDLPWPAQVQIEILDVTGRHVAAPKEVHLSAGWGQEVELSGLQLSSGPYLYRIKAMSMDDNSISVLQGFFVSVQI